MTDQIKQLTLPMHLLCLASFFIIDYTWLNALGIFIGWVFIGGFGVAVGYHRYFSHKSFQTYSIIEKILAWLGALSLEGSIIFWVALHRVIHHRLADKEGDLHSPILGKWSAFFGWQNKITPASVPMMGARDLLRDPFKVWMHENYNKVVWVTVIVVALMSWQFALGILIPSMIISFHTDNFINVFGHWPKLGYRNYDTNDKSCNNLFFGYLCWGQGWHNNHHAEPATADFGRKWWEYDTAARILIPLIKKDETRN